MAKRLKDTKSPLNIISISFNHSSPYKIKFNYSRLFISIYFILSAVSIPIIKLIVKKLLYSKEFLKERVLIVGENKKEVKRFKKELKSNIYLGQIPSTKDYSTIFSISDGIDSLKLSSTIQTIYIKI